MQYGVIQLDAIRNYHNLMQTKQSDLCIYVKYTSINAKEKDIHTMGIK